MGPDPLRLPFFVGLGGTAVAGAWMLLLPDPEGKRREPWRISWARSPPAPGTGWLSGTRRRS